MEKRLKKTLWSALLALMVAMVGATTMGAELAPPKQEAILGALGGSSTAGSCSGGSASSATAQAACEAGGGTWSAGTGATGIYELRGTVTLGLSILLGIVMLFAGYRLVRMFINRGSVGR